MSTKNLSEVKENIAVAQVVHHGSEISIPEKMTLAEAIATLKRREEYMEEETAMQSSFNFFPTDGANALQIVLQKQFGWASAEPIETMFGKRPPQMIEIEIAPKVYRKVPWGRFSIPGTEGGVLNCAVTMENDMVAFALSSTVKRKYESVVEQLFANVRNELETNSIYRGKAIKIRFKDDDGDQISWPEPQFMDLTDVDEQMLIYSESVQREIDINLFTPILRVNDLIANNVPTKRGILLAGSYGTGKTLGAKVAAKHAVATGNTFVYIPHADDLNYAVKFAQAYQSPACVIFAEDIDRALEGDRTVAMDDILNIIDGIDTKTSNIITVLTTNHIEKINPTMLRPGRLDAIIEVTPPDAKAVERLIRAYGAEAIAADVDLTEAGNVLSGAIPAVIAEVVKRAKLAQLRYIKPGERITGLSQEAILDAAKSIRQHIDLLERRSNEGKKQVPALEHTLMTVIRAALTRDTSELADA